MTSVGRILQFPPIPQIPEPVAASRSSSSKPSGSASLPTATAFSSRFARSDP
jgi:hypothetical protein